MIWAFVTARIVTNPLSNVFQKMLTRRAARPLTVILVTHAVLALVCFPPCLPYLNNLPKNFWIDMSICAVLAVAANSLIVYALKLSDLSVLGPVNAYKSVVSLLPGIVLLGEIPGVSSLFGIGLILAGSVFLAEPAKSTRGKHFLAAFFADRGVQYRFAALILSAIEAVFLKRALLASSPWITFLFWAELCLVVSALAFAVSVPRTWRQDAAILRGALAPCLALSATTGLMQLTTLLSFERLPVGPALALFQTSAILSVLLGHQVFDERHLVRRLIGSVVMVGGAVLIVMGR